jgi:hypothetical protein
VLSFTLFETFYAFPYSSYHTITILIMPGSKFESIRRRLLGRKRRINPDSTVLPRAGTLSKTNQSAQSNISSEPANDQSQATQWNSSLDRSPGVVDASVPDDKNDAGAVAQPDYEGAPKVGINRARTTMTLRSFYDNLRDQVEKKMDDEEIGLDVKKTYLPNSKRAAFVTPDNIRQAMPGASSELIEFIVSKSPKTFLATLFAIHDSERGHIAMQSFMYHNFTDDECLPVEKLTAKDHDSGNDRCNHNWEGDDVDTYDCSLCDRREGR